MTYLERYDNSILIIYADKNHFNEMSMINDVNRIKTQI